jgi:glycosyltransferase involved in cell wall biosynthesis
VNQVEEARLEPLAARMPSRRIVGASQSNLAPASRHILYVCNTLGQPDHDRCNALARDGWSVTAIDWSRDDTGYIWEKTEKSEFAYREIKVRSRSYASQAHSFFALLGAINPFKFKTVIVYGFHNLAFFLFSIYLRSLGTQVFTMCDSRFSDYSRSIFRDFIKRALFLPYSACLAASNQAAEYAHYLGFKRIEVYRCAIDTRRVKRIAESANVNAAFAGRYFICVSRFVEKKNLAFMLRAYARYAAQSPHPRQLRLVGYGDLRDDIAGQIDADPNLASRVTISDYVPASAIPGLLGGAIGLVFPSTTDQFGIVVTEALSAGIPAIVSANCGAAELIAPWANGVVVSPNSIEDISRAFSFIDCNESEWLELSREAEQSSQAGDVSIFLEALRRLLH